jgi:DNA-binding MltR family transcriptional regulator
MNSRKRAVSIRMNANDIGNVKKLAQRLGVRDSDVIRCAVKMMMAKLGPLADTTVRGRNLVPVLMESGGDLLRHFDIDAVRLESIINDGVNEGAQVEHDDVQLIAMNGMQRSYIKLRLSALNNAQQPESDPQRNNVERLDESLRQYLFDKYVYRTGLAGNGSNGVHVGEAQLLRSGSKV